MPHNFFYFKFYDLKKLLIPTFILIASCSSHVDKKEIPNTDKQILKQDISGCYEMIISKDSAFMNINSDQNMVSGNLEYKRFEKDSNKGNFTGTINENYIDIWYNFQSEGIISVRQIRFKIDGEKLLEGYGDVEQKGDTVYFKYPQTLKYEDDHPFTKVNCR